MMIMLPALRSRRRERGVASLIVVLVLFFIVSMVAAYTNRNLIFEQRTGANQYRSTQAMEAAQAGLEWAKIMLNEGRITAACLPSTSSTDSSFRTRYLSADAAGVLTARLMSSGAQLTPSCVYNGTDWDCDCPSNAAPSLTPSTSNAVLPAFRIRMLTGSSVSGGRPGMVRIEAIGCTRLDNICLDFQGQGEALEGRAIVTELLSLTGGLPSPPMAALTAGGNVDLGGAAMAVHNNDRDAGGITIQARGTVTPAGLVLTSTPGTAGVNSIVDADVSLPATADRMFGGFFNMWPATYRLQPATVVLNLNTDPGHCTATGCTAQAVIDAAQMNPGRAIWVDGDLVIDSAGNVGSATDPVLVVVSGNLSFTTGVTLYGLVYTRTATWATSGAGVVRGAVVAEGNVGGSGTPTLIFDADVLKRLRVGIGSMIKVPGGWKDFCSTSTGAMGTPTSPSVAGC